MIYLSVNDQQVFLVNYTFHSQVTLLLIKTSSALQKKWHNQFLQWTHILGKVENESQTLYINSRHLLVEEIWLKNSFLGFSVEFVSPVSPKGFILLNLVQTESHLHFDSDYLKVHYGILKLLQYKKTQSHTN